MSNLFSIWSPKGEHFEVSKPNFDDLRKHYGWSPTPPETSTAAIAAATKGKKNGEEGSSVSGASSDAGAAKSAAVPAASEPAAAANADAGETAAGGEAGEGSVDSGAEEVTKESLIEALTKFGIDADKRKSVAGLQALLAEAEATAAK